LMDIQAKGAPESTARCVMWGKGGPEHIEKIGICRHLGQAVGKARRMTQRGLVSGKMIIRHT
jgi:hypothetical protein